MAGKPIALLGNMHVCPKVEPGPVPHVGGPVIKTQSLVKVNGIPAAVVGDKCLCTGCGMTASITSGSSVVTINGKAVARMGDSTAHGGKLVQGMPTITIE